MAPSPPRLRILSGMSLWLAEFSTLPFSAENPTPVQIHHRFTVPPLMASTLNKFCIVGGNAVSAFLSWRLQATNACDVTLVWKSGFESVAQYGITFRYNISVVGQLRKAY